MSDVTAIDGNLLCEGATIDNTVAAGDPPLALADANDFKWTEYAETPEGGFGAG